MTSDPAAPADSPEAAGVVESAAPPAPVESPVQAPILESAPIVAAGATDLPDVTPVAEPSEALDPAAVALRERLDTMRQKIEASLAALEQNASRVSALSGGTRFSTLQKTHGNFVAELRLLRSQPADETVVARCDGLLQSIDRLVAALSAPGAAASDGDRPPAPVNPAPIRQALIRGMIMLAPAPLHLQLEFDPGFPFAEADPVVLAARSHAINRTALGSLRRIQWEAPDRCSLWFGDGEQRRIATASFDVQGKVELAPEYRQKQHPQGAPKQPSGPGQPSGAQRQNKGARPQNTGTRPQNPAVRLQNRDGQPGATRPSGTAGANAGVSAAATPAGRERSRRRGGNPGRIAGLRPEGSPGHAEVKHPTAEGTLAPQEGTLATAEGSVAPVSRSERQNHAGKPNERKGGAHGPRRESRPTEPGGSGGPGGPGGSQRNRGSSRNSGPRDGPRTGPRDGSRDGSRDGPRNGPGSGPRNAPGPGRGQDDRQARSGGRGGGFPANSMLADKLRAALAPAKASASAETAAAATAAADAGTGSSKPDDSGKDQS